MKLTRMIAAAPFLLAACATEEAPVSDEEDEAAKKAAYEKCLQDNMAVATAWEMIEEQCRRQAGLEEKPRLDEPERDDPLEGKPAKGKPET